MALEAKVYAIDNSIVSPNGEVNGRVRFVDESGNTVPGMILPPLPTADGDYLLTVSSGEYSWTADGS